MSRNIKIVLIVAAAVLVGSLAAWLVQNNSKKAKLEAPETIESIIK